MFLGVVLGAESEKNISFFLSYQKMSFFGQFMVIFRQKMAKSAKFLRFSTVLCIIFALYFSLTHPQPNPLKKPPEALG